MSQETKHLRHAFKSILDVYCAVCMCRSVLRRAVVLHVYVYRIYCTTNARMPNYDVKPYSTVQHSCIFDFTLLHRHSYRLGAAVIFVLWSLPLSLFVVQVCARAPGLCEVVQESRTEGRHRIATTSSTTSSSSSPSSSSPSSRMLRRGFKAVSAAARSTILAHSRVTRSAVTYRAFPAVRHASQATSPPTPPGSPQGKSDDGHGASASPSRDELLKKIRNSPEVLSAMVKLIETLESKGLSTDKAPTPEQWEKMMLDEQVQHVLGQFAKACDDAGVPLNANVLQEMTRGMTG